MTPSQAKPTAPRRSRAEDADRGRRAANEVWLDQEVELGAGDSVELTILAGPLAGRSFHTPVRSMRDENAYLVAPLGGELGPAPGTPVRIGLRVGTGFYAARTTVEEHVRQSAATLLLGVPVPDGFEPLEQRAHFRLPTAIAPQRAILSGGGGRRDLRSIITNVSGGGAELAAAQAAMLGAQVDLDFDLGPLSVVSRGRVRGSDRPAPGRSSHRLHCEFVDLDARTQERIVRFVFDAQRDLLRRGLLGGAS